MDTAASKMLCSVQTEQLRSHMGELCQMNLIGVLFSVIVAWKRLRKQCQKQVNAEKFAKAGKDWQVGQYTSIRCFPTLVEGHSSAPLRTFGYLWHLVRPTTAQRLRGSIPTFGPVPLGWLLPGGWSVVQRKSRHWQHQGKQNQNTNDKYIIHKWYRC